MRLLASLMLVVTLIFLLSGSAAGTETYTITASWGIGGTITPTGITTVVNGTSQTFVITADFGYEIAGVYADSIRVGKVAEYTFANVSSNHTIHAEFIGTPIITGPELAMNGSVGTFTITAANAQTIGIAFGSEAAVKYNATNGKVLLTRMFTEAGSSQITASAYLKNETDNTSASMGFNVEMLEPADYPVVNDTEVNIEKAGGCASRIVQFSMNQSECGDVLQYTVKDETNSLPKNYGPLPENKKVLAVVNLTPVMLQPAVENLSEFTILINKTIIGADDKSMITAYLNSEYGGKYVQIPLAVTYNTSANTKTDYAYDVAAPGFSVITFAVRPESGSPAPVPTPTIEPTPVPTKKPIHFTTITIPRYPTSFKYTTTIDKQDRTVNTLTVFSVLKQSGKVIETKVWPGGIYIQSIDGKAEDADLNGWLYQVNGVVPSQMADQCAVTSGDEIIWYYSKSMESKPEESEAAFGFIVEVEENQPIVENKTAEISELKPAENTTIPILAPDGVVISNRNGVQKLAIDTSITNAGGHVTVPDDKTIVMIMPGLKMNFTVTGMERGNYGTEEHHLDNSRSSQSFANCSPGAKYS